MPANSGNSLVVSIENIIAGSCNDIKPFINCDAYGRQSKIYL